MIESNNPSHIHDITNMGETKVIKKGDEGLSDITNVWESHFVAMAIYRQGVSFEMTYAYH